MVAGEPTAEEGARRPWLPVGGVIAAVIAVFAVLTLVTPKPAPTLTLTELPAGDQMPIATLLPQVSIPSDVAHQLYLQSCSGCHGGDANGVPNLGNSLIESKIIDKPDAEMLGLRSRWC